MNRWDNVNEYKKARKKSYDIAVCMPPIGTVVINKLEQAMTVKYLHGKTFFTASDMTKLSPVQRQELENLVQLGKAYCVSQQQPFVLAGTLGEMWTVTPDVLARKYAFIQDGQPVQINQQTLNSRMKNGQLDWTKIRSLPDNSACFACFVPRTEIGQISTQWGAVLDINGREAPHGKGDFVIAERLPNGQINMNNRWVVNGDIFATTYDNSGWGSCINPNLKGDKKNISIKDLPCLIDTPLTDNNLYRKLSQYSTGSDFFTEPHLMSYFKNSNCTDGAKYYKTAKHFYVRTGSTDIELVFSNGYYASFEIPNVASPHGGFYGLYPLTLESVKKIITEAEEFRASRR